MTETAATPSSERDARPQPAGSAFRTPSAGLGASEVDERIRAGKVNDAGERTSRTFGEIVKANVLTRFNAILGTLLVLIVWVGPLQDALFGIVLVANALIGIVQEYRAKRTLDRLAVLAAAKVRVVRDGSVAEVGAKEVVLDDLVDLRPGDQIPADGELAVADGLEVDESLLTGESEPVDKSAGDDVMSGSFVVAGSGRFQATAVGQDAYAHRLATEARRFTLVRSEIVAGINQILRYVTWAIFPTAAVLALSQFDAHDEWREALSGIVAGAAAMVPEGLVLLTSIAFGLAAVTLARRQVLVQELPAVEVLARVDVVCLDKTGTITEGSIAFDELERLADNGDVEHALGALAADDDRNATMAAVAEAFPEATWKRTARVPFSSARKWSAASYEGQGSWVLGAPEMVIADADHDARSRADEFASSGRRVLLLARSSASLEGEELPSDLEPVALVVFEERIRPDASDTLAYFSEQGVTLRVISGDNPVTVGAVAARVGLEGADDPVDARTLPEDVDALADVVEARSVYGRVTPHQKRSMVAALQSRDHVVAMTGDGVNDALALKDADIGIAMGSGAPATRAVAQLVLLDGRFASMPGVVAEGRRVIANVERVANLFITKTVYAVLLAVTVGVFRWPYPFLPRHLTIVSSLTIGIPAFFLALAPNPQRYVPGFIARVGRFAIPAGTVAAIATGLSFVYARDVADVPLDVERTVATITLLIVGLYVLSILARPLTPARVLLVGSMVGLFLLAVLVPFAQDFFALEPPTGETLVVNLLIAAAACGVLEIGWTIVQHRLPKEDRTPRVLLRGWQGAQRSPIDVLRDVLGLTPTDTARDRVAASDDR